MFQQWNGKGLPMASEVLRRINRFERAGKRRMEIVGGSVRPQ